jgi:tellurite methyltransferase
MTAQEYWDEFYKQTPFKGGKSPLPFLVEMFPRLQKGKALDVGMGEGANAVFMAQKGMAVKGFDISPVAIEHAQTLAKETGVSIEAKSADLDLFIMGLLEYDTVIMTFFKPPIERYYSEIIRTLKQGGTLLIHSYGSEEMKESLGQDEAYRNYFFHSNEILRQLKGMKILFYHEGKVDGKHVVQCLAQKPLDRDAAKYNLFGMQTQQEPGKPKSSQQQIAENLFKKKS